MTTTANRILRLLAERWPVTLDEVALALRLRPDVVNLEAKRLAARGLVRLEPLGDKTYVALAGKAVRPAGPPAKPADPDDPSVA